MTDFSKCKCCNRDDIIIQCVYSNYIGTLYVVSCRDCSEFTSCKLDGYIDQQLISEKCASAWNDYMAAKGEQS